MQRKKLTAFLILIVILSVGFYMLTTKSIVISVTDDIGSPVPNADFLLYSYHQHEPILIANGVTNSKGMATIRSSIFNMSPDNTGVYYSYILHATHPAYGVVTKNWSDKKQREGKKLEIVFETDYNMAQVLQKLDYQGAGVFRTERVVTIETLENTTVGLLVCDSDDSDFHVEVEQAPGVEYDVQAKRQTFFPLVGSWKDAGWIRTIKNQNNRNHWYNTAVQENYDGIYVSTDFRYIQEVWEYQERDKESRDLWHTRQRWVEVKASGVHGSTMYGSMVKLEDNLISNQDLTLENGSVIKVEANIPKTIIADTSYYFHDACNYIPKIEGYDTLTPTTFDLNIHYNSSFIFTFGSRTYNNNRFVYDNGTSGAIWYVAGE